METGGFSNNQFAPRTYYEFQEYRWMNKLSYSRYQPYTSSPHPGFPL